VDFIDESEVLTPADEEESHLEAAIIECRSSGGARNLGEAVRRIAEGAAMIRTKGEAGSGNVVEAVRHMRTIVSEMKRLTHGWRDDELMRTAKEIGAPLDLIREIAKTGQVAGCRIFRRVELRRLRMRRWCGSLERKRCSSGSGIFKRQAIRTHARRPS